MKPKDEQFELIDGVLDFLENQLSIMAQPVKGKAPKCNNDKPKGK